MTRRWRLTAAALLGGLAALAAGLPRGEAQAPAPRPPEPRPGDTRGPGPGPGGPGGQAGYPGDMLQAAYDELTLATLAAGSEASRLSRDDAALLRPAKDFYKAAVQARRDGAERRATEYALAAANACDGIMQMEWANAADITGLPAPRPPARAAAPGAGRDAGPREAGEAPRPVPARPDTARPADRDLPPPRGAEDRPPPPRDTAPPPRGDALPPPRAGGPAAPATPEAAAREMLAQLRDRLSGRAEETTLPSARPFADASRRAYDEARRALEAGDTRKAIGLAMAADAWSRVGDHLRRAEAPDTGTGRGDTRAPRDDRPREAPPARPAPPPDR
jgi:hypothetical protein